ncbi:daf-6 [Cordylochernes scorpioides]|uniref:Daf-6 n=1 Tax=Cordylochernes scorpioides TaxID=51811 RepID=A0ABY6KIU5_9ARAC|nr:daf-6 [Cordylochernes scorpioides]
MVVADAMKFVNDLMSAGCGKLGILLSRRPDYFILLPVFLTAVLASYLQHLDYNRDLFLLFTPQNGRAMKDRAYVEHLFGSAANHDMSRSLGLPLLCAAILVCKDSKSILRPELFNEVRRVDSGVENLTGTYHGRSYSYPELCDKNPTGECIKVNSVLDLNDGRLARVNSGHSDIKYPLRLELEELIIETMGFQMGGVQLDQNGNVLSAESIILVYFLNATKFDPIAFEWSKSFIKYLQDFESDKVDIAMFTWRATEDGFEDTILVALMFFIGTLVIMVLFTFVTSSSSNGLPWLGILGCLSSILSLISSFGFTVILGYDLIAVAVVVPFLMLDQTFLKVVCCMKEISSSRKQVEDHFLMRFFRDKVGTVLTDWRGQAAVIGVYLLTIATGLYGFTYYTEGMQLQRLVTYDHYLVKFFDRMDQYYRVYPYRIQIVVEGDLDYGDPDVRARVDGILKKFEESRFISDNKQLTESWLRAYQYALDSSFAQMLGITCEEPRNGSFARCIHDLMETIPLANIFLKDVIFDDTGDKILASRHVIQSYLINNTVDEKHMVQDLRAIAEASSDDSVKVTVYNGWFLYFDQFIYMESMAVLSLSSALVIVIVVSFLFIPKALCTIWIAVSSVSIFVTVLGYLSYWGVSMDMVGLVGLIMCIGFSVDYAFHISFAYVSSQELLPSMKLRNALYTMGMPILQSSVSTLIGVLVLCFIPSYCFSAFIKTVFLVIALGTIHDLELLLLKRNLVPNQSAFFL